MGWGGVGVSEAKEVAPGPILSHPGTWSLLRGVPRPTATTPAQSSCRSEGV